MVSYNMIYLIILTIVPAMLASGYAVSAPHKIQKMLNTKIDISPEKFLETLGKAERIYLFTSIAPFLLAPMLGFSELPRGIFYCCLIFVFALISFVFKEKFIKSKILIILASTAELVIYCDILRSGVIEVWR